MSLSLDAPAGLGRANRIGLTRFRRAPLAVKQGDRVAQLILERIVTPEVQEVESLAETVRGAGGFGSTGGFGAVAGVAAEEPVPVPESENGSKAA